VAGWNGTSPVFFVALAPSRADGKERVPFPDDPCRLYYLTLAKRGYSNAHLTDLVKARTSIDKIDSVLKDERQMRQNKDWLLEEARVLRPRLVVALDRRVERWLRKWMPNVRLEYVPHYSWVQRGMTAVRAWEKGWRRLRHSKE